MLDLQVLLSVLSRLTDSYIDGLVQDCSNSIGVTAVLHEAIII